MPLIDQVKYQNFVIILMSTVNVEMIFIRVRIATMLSFPKELWLNVPPFEKHSIIYHELIENYVDIIRHSISE